MCACEGVRVCVGGCPRTSTQVSDFVSVWMQMYHCVCDWVCAWVGVEHQNYLDSKYVEKLLESVSSLFSDCQSVFFISGIVLESVGRTSSLPKETICCWF